jgi:Golgi phosphoprotein 3
MKLTLPEEVMLLALQDDKGTLISGTHSDLAIGGAALADLLLEERIEIEQTKKKMLNVLNAGATGDPFLDECLEKVSSSKRRASAQTWVQRFSGIKNAKHKVATTLCNKGVLKADEDKILGIFTRKIYPELNPMPEREVLDRLRDAVFGDVRNIQPRTIVLISLAQSSNLLKTVFDKQQLKENKKRIKQIAEGEISGQAVAKAVEAATVAIAMTAIMPAIFVTTTT